MDDTITIDRAGRLVLPKGIRDRFHMKGGSRLEVAVVGDHVELTPVTDDDTNVEIIDEDGLLVLSGGGEPFDAVEALQADREERDEHLAP